jgi:hypothetical protein
MSEVQGAVVVDFLALEHAAVPVVGILAEADIGNHDHFREPFLHGPHRFLNDAILGIGAGAQGVFAVRQTKKNDGRNVLLGSFLNVLHQVIEGLLKVPRHGWDRVFDVLAPDGKQRQNEIVGGQLGLADHAA